MTQTFTPPAFSELARIREWLKIPPETVREYVPQIDEADTSPYRETIRNTYALFLCRKLIWSITGSTSSQLPVLPQNAPSQNVPAMKDLADMRVRLRLRMDEASLKMHISAGVLSDWECGNRVPTLAERRRYWELLQDCQSGKESYTPSQRQRYRYRNAPAQLTFKA